MMKNALLILVLLVGPIWLGPASAQDPLEWVRSKARAIPSGEGSLAMGDPEIALEVTEEGSVLSAILGYDFGEGLANSIELRLSGKLNDGQQELELANRNDLPGGIEASLKFSRALSKTSTKDADKRCKKVNDFFATQIPAGLQDAWTALETELASIDEGNVAPDSGDDDSPTPGELRFVAYQELWSDFFGLWTERHATLETKSDRTATEDFELASMVSIDIPFLDELLDNAVRYLCGKWNEGRIVDLLLVPRGRRGLLDCTPTRRDLASVRY